MKKRPSAAISNLFLPTLDVDADKVDEVDQSIWNTRIMKAVYTCVIAAYMFRSGVILYGIPVVILIETTKLLSKWTCFFGEDPCVVKARKGFHEHHKQIMEELHRTMNGGGLRRRQEIFMAGIGYSSIAYIQEYIDRKSSAIGERTMKEYRERISHYTSSAQ